MKHVSYLLLILLAAGDAPTLLQKRGPAELLTSAPREDDQLLMKFSDLLTLTVRIEANSELTVESPVSWTRSPAWKSRNRGQPVLTSHEKSRVWQQSFDLDPLAPGTHAVQLEPVRYRAGKGEWQTLTWQPFEVRVSSSLADPDPKTLRERTPIEELPAPPATARWPAAIFVVLLVLAALAIPWLRRKKIIVERTPLELALHELDRLERLRLPENGKSEEFHTLLANIVRRFLERQHHLPARRQTTREFLADLEGSAALTHDQKSFLADFLHRCDLAKFARANVSGPEASELLERTRRFFNEPEV